MTPHDAGDDARERPTDDETSNAESVADNSTHDGASVVDTGTSDAESVTDGGTSDAESVTDGERPAAADAANGGRSAAGTPVTDGGTPENASSDGGTADGGLVASDTLAVNREGLLATLPGNAAGLGVLVTALTLAWLLSPVAIDVPGIVFPFLEVATLFVLYSLVLLGLNLQFGDTGIINFGPVLFLGLGLYGMALVSAEVPEFGTGVGLGMFWGVGIAVGVVAAVVGGIVLGVSSLRLREDYLAVTTLAAAEILFEAVRVFQNPFGGERGLVGIPQLVVEEGRDGVLPFAENGATQDVATLLLFFGLLLVAYEAFRRLSGSPYGRVLRSIQADEDATRGMGKSTLSYKIQVFIYGAIVAGVAGALMGMFFGSASPSFISIDVTVIIWIGMMIGGAGRHRGAIVGLAIIMFFELIVRLGNQTVTNLGVIDAVQFNALRGALVGLLLILVIRYRPEGLFGDPEKLEVFK